MTPYLVSYSFNDKDGTGYGQMVADSPTKPPSMKFVKDTMDLLRRTKESVIILNMIELLEDRDEQEET